jgi:pimeloyl-ACP methyl ester carboxylesterase
LPALAPHFAVYAPDLLGCGLSEKPATDYSIETLARGVVALMDALGVERASVIGHSLGGGVALMLHRLYPERVGRLALVSSGGLGRELHWLLRINALPGAEGVLRVLSDPRSTMPSVSLALQRRRMRALRAAYDAEMPTVLHRLRDPRARRAFVRMARAVSDLKGQTSSALSHLPTIECPVLVVWGGRDGILPVAHGHEAARLLRRGHLRVLPASAHRPQVDEPDAFNEIVLDFLSTSEWPPEESDGAGGEIALVPAQALVTAHTNGRRRLVGSRSARMAVALAAVGLAAGAGWRYAPRSTRVAMRHTLRARRASGD